MSHSTEALPRPVRRPLRVATQFVSTTAPRHKPPKRAVAPYYKFLTKLEQEARRK